MFKVGFFQGQNTKDLPHMNMPLFVNDIKNLGCDFECICVSVQKLKQLLNYVKKVKFDLIAIDYIFPIPFIDKLKEVQPGAKVVIGGGGCFDSFFKSNIDFAIIGAGRKGFLSLTAALKNKNSLENIPNLFSKIRKGKRVKIDYSGNNVALDLKKELFPYRPYLDWRHIGFAGKEIKVPHPTIVADFGCPHRAHKLNRHYADVTLQPLSEQIFTDRARERLEDLFRERMRGGCSFCTYYSYTSLPPDETVDCLMKQLRFLQQRYGYQMFSIGSEYPFRFILPLLNRIVREKIQVKQLYLRSRPNWVNQHEQTLIEALKLAKKINLKINLWQLGFESFIQEDLDIYNKGCSVTDNRRTLKLIKKFDARFPQHFFCHPNSHGYLPINPWLHFNRLKQFCSEEAFPSRFNYNKERSLVLFDRFLPVYQKLRKEGLLIEYKDNLDSYSFKDKKVEFFLDIIYKLEQYLSEKPFLHHHKHILIQVKRNVFIEIKNYSSAKNTTEFKRKITVDNRQYIDNKIAQAKNACIKSAVNTIHSAFTKNGVRRKARDARHSFLLISSLYKDTRLSDLRKFNIKGKAYILNSKHNQTYRESKVDTIIMNAMSAGVEVNELLARLKPLCLK